MRTVITYGTFDLFHIGHLRLLERAAALGDRLVVGVSTDEFNRGKNKYCIHTYEERTRIVNALKVVDKTFSEEDWDQKRSDIQKYDVDVFVMGDDWKGKFDFLAELCEVVYLPRTPDVSTTDKKKLIDNGSVRLADWLESG
jgi:choline-phosphate cytidylyltransferase/glycerol-3-phosphate cytidylyltransferase